MTNSQVKEPEWAVRLCTMDGVFEYGEGEPVRLSREPNGRLSVVAYNQSGHDCTAIDLEQLLEWVEKHGEQYGLALKRT